MGKFSLVFFILVSIKCFGANSYVFVENKGQWPAQVQYKVNLPSGALFIDQTKFTYHFRDSELLQQIHDKQIKVTDSLSWKHHAYSMKFLGASSELDASATDAVEANYNYFLGNDESKWASQVSAFQNVKIKNLYPSIDAHWYGKGDNLKYDLVVKPNGNPSDIIIEYQGLGGISLRDGKLNYLTSVTTIIENAPLAYQFIDGRYQEVECKFVLNENQVRFQVGEYDQSKTLVIDPDLIFSTYSGASSNNFGYSATFDKFGNLYSGSTSFGIGYPTTIGAYSTSFSSGSTDIAISKFNDDGSSLLYSTYVGGSGDEMPHSLIVDEQGNLYALATTGSSNFPVPGGFDTSFAEGSFLFLNGLGVTFSIGTDIAAFKLSADGSQLLGSTYLGGTSNDGLNVNGDLHYNYADEVRGEILLDNNGDVLIVSSTQSSDFTFGNTGLHATYRGGSQDGVIIKMTPDLDQLLWGTYFGGNGADALYSVAVNDQNEIYVAGGTTSTDFNAQSFSIFNAYQGGRADAIIAKLNANGDQLVASTYYGTAAYDQVYFIDLDKDENIYVYGQTEINGSPFQINSAFGQLNAGQFVTKFNPTLSNFVWSSQFGVNTPSTQNAQPNISPTAFLVDICSNVYLAGWGGTTNQPSPFNGVTNNATNTNGLPTTANALQDTTDGSDFYVLVIRDDGNAAVYGSFFGGPQSAEHVDGGTSRFDKSGKIYQAVCAGCGGFSDMFTTPNAYSSTNGASCNLGVFKYDFNLPLVNSSFSIEDVGCAPFAPTFQNLSTTHTATDFSWSLNGSFFSSDSVPTLSLGGKGWYEIQLIVNDTNSCNVTDTSVLNIEIDVDSIFQLPPILSCLGDSAVLGISPQPNETYTWVNPQNAVDTNLSELTVLALENSIYTLLIEEEICTDTAFQTLSIDSFSVQLSNDTLLCGPLDSFRITMNSVGTLTSYFLSSTENFLDTLRAGSQAESILINPDSAENRYFFLAENANACLSLDTFTLNLNLFAFESLADTIVCRGDTLEIELSALHNPVAQIGWNSNSAILSGDSSTAVLVLPTNPVELFYVAEDINGCLASDTLVLALDSIVLAGLADTFVCGPISEVAIPVSILAGTGSVFLFSSGNLTDTLDEGINSLNILNPTNDNLYTVLAQNNRGCEDAQDFLLEVSLFELESDSVLFICRNDTALLLATELEGSIAAINWFNTANIIGSSDNDSVLALPLVNEIFFFEAFNADSCLVQDSVSVRVSQISLDSISISLSEDSAIVGEIVSAQAFPAGYSYQWFVGNSSQPIDSNQFTEITITETTFIELLVSDAENETCAELRRDTVGLIEVNCNEPNLYIPNAFSPNNDGKNDLFRVRGNHIELVDLEVFNRWGTLLYESNGDSKGWDGSYNNASLEPDVFVYTARVTCIDGQVYETKGNVTLLK